MRDTPFDNLCARAGEPAADDRCYTITSAATIVAPFFAVTRRTAEKYIRERCPMTVLSPRRVVVLGRDLRRLIDDMMAPRDEQPSI